MLKVAGFRSCGRFVFSGLAWLGFLMVFFTLTPAVLWWADALAGPWRDPGGDVLIVLGGSTIEHVVDLSSYWRGVYANLVWQEGTFRQVVISGGGNGVEPAAEPLRRFIQCIGVPGGAIRVETRSNSTHENALFTARLLRSEPGRKVLLTSDYHMFRSYRAFRKAGLNVEPRPFPDVIKRGQHWKERWPCALDLLLETIKIGYYWVRGWI